MIVMEIFKLFLCQRVIYVFEMYREVNSTKIREHRNKLLCISVQAASFLGTHTDTCTWVVKVQSWVVSSGQWPRLWSLAPSGFLTRGQQHCHHLVLYLLIPSVPSVSPFLLRSSSDTIYAFETQKGSCLGTHLACRYYFFSFLCNHLNEDTFTPKKHLCLLCVALKMF